MSFTHFEGGTNKEHTRQQLIEARNEMLEDAKQKAIERGLHQELKGETNRILPSVDKKLQIRERENKKCKKRRNKNKKSKKTKRQSHKKSKSDTSSCEDSDNFESDSSVNYDEYDKKTKSKKTKKENDERSRSLHKAASRKETQSTEVEERTLQRDSWMTDSLLLKTYSKERIEKKFNETQKFEIYDPCKNIKELNPYWKATGTGLPTTFQKPKNDTGEAQVEMSNNKGSFYKKENATSQGWRKKDAGEGSKSLSRKTSKTPNSGASSAISKIDNKADNKIQHEVAFTTDILTDQQMNELGAKLIKAEIMGNTTLAEELKKKLEKARMNRLEIKERKKLDLNKADEYKKQPVRCQHILLTCTDVAGNSRPFPQNFSNSFDSYGNQQKRRKQPRNETHEKGQRMRYDADDDKYDIKEMFEKEKYTSSADNNMQFVNMASKHNSLHHDQEDIFTEKASQYDEQKAEKRALQQSIREYQKLEKVLDNCDKCLNSAKMQKELLVAVGEKVYLALPWHVGLQIGHCVIVSNQHIACATQLDEDAWAEVQEFRKALTRMFDKQHKDVIFYEIANRLHRKPHLTIHCVPVDQKEGEMAPFYFKKAIEESEREWSVNKQLVTLREYSLRKCIPKGLPYLWVNFGIGNGFAHVIEEEDRFPNNFAQEIIGGLLEMESVKWRKLHKEQNIKQKVQMFANCWEKYDFTK